jgi:PAS domain S-box-containing protein
VQFEHDVVGRDGASWRVSATAAPVRDARGRPLYLFVQAQDVTGQRLAEEALSQSERRFRLLVDAVNDYAIFMLDTHGYVVSWNAGAQRLKGYRADEIIGRHFSMFYPPDKVAERHPEHELELALRDGRYEEEGWRVRKDGSQFWANVLISAVHDSNGRHVGFAKVTRDVTERRSLLSRLASAADEQAQYLAVTAHELRTPISVISGTTELLRERWAQLDEDERDELLASMGQNAARMRRLLDDLLTAARLEAGAVELQRDNAPLAPLLETAAAAARRRAADAEITVAMEDDLVVDADVGRVAQMLDNLLVNAVTHGRPPVAVRVVQRDGRAEIRVSDSGPGVPDEIAPRLFDRFVTLKQRTGGGLGLFIVRELAHAHGGDAWYEGTGDQGRPTFVVSLPLAGQRD